MKIKAEKKVETDRLFLISSEKLMQHVNKDDLCCRDSVIVEDAYHKDWFFEKDGSRYFIPPAAYIKDGEIFFINGRHRAILLVRHTPRFPFLIGNIDFDTINGTAPKKASLEVMDSIKVGDFEEGSTFCLPDFDLGDFKPA